MRTSKASKHLNRFKAREEMGYNDGGPGFGQGHAGHQTTNLDAGRGGLDS